MLSNFIMPKHSRPDITAVLNVHNEGWMSYPSITSMNSSIKHAESIGLSVEILVIMDQADAITEEFVNYNCLPDTRIEHISEGDAAAARNYAISKAHGDYIAFLDGDDLWCTNWLSAAYNEASKQDGLYIWHPEVNIYFGEADYLFLHRGSDDVEFYPEFLIAQNYWTALSFGKRTIYKMFVYPAEDLSKGFAFEDWQWNLETSMKGVLHKTVSKTTHFIRSKIIGSRVKLHTRHNCLIKVPHSFLERIKSI